MTPFFESPTFVWQSNRVLKPFFETLTLVWNPWLETLTFVFNLNPDLEPYLWRLKSMVSTAVWLVTPAQVKEARPTHRKRPVLRTTPQNQGRNSRHIMSKVQKVVMCLLVKETFRPGAPPRLPSSHWRCRPSSLTSEQEKKIPKTQFGQGFKTKRIDSICGCSLESKMEPCWVAIAAQWASDDGLSYNLGFSGAGFFILLLASKPLLLGKDSGASIYECIEKCLLKNGI